MQKQCSQCGSTLNCTATESSSCWCMDYPNVLPIDAAADCLCASCLMKSIQSKISRDVDTLAVHLTAPEQATQFQNQPLIEGVDYEVENGLWVFSRWFHLKRGTCCGNQCRNCPFGYVNVK